MRVTQFDIAKLAEVSQATVSRVLGGDTRVEPEIRDRVLDIIREKNYQPDARARSLRTRRTRLIGLVLKRPHGGLGDDPFFAALTAGIIDVLCGHAYHLCVDMVTDDVAQEGVYDEMLRTRRVDGLILVEPEASDERITLLQRDRFPFVLIGNPGAAPVASVDNDNVRAGEMATQHLIDQGYQRIGFLAGPRGVAVSEDRITGYQAALAARSLPSQIEYCDFGFRAARDHAVEMFRRPERPDALLILDDFMAFGAVIAARAARLSIPDQLGLVSFNDSSLCHLIDGGLSSVNLGLNQLVQTAVSKLLAIIDGEDFGDLRDVIPCELQVRGSSQPHRT